MSLLSNFVELTSCSSYFLCSCSYRMMQKQGILPMHTNASEPFGNALDGWQMVDDDHGSVETSIFKALRPKIQIQKCCTLEVCNTS